MSTTMDYVQAKLPDYADTYVKDMLSQTQALTDVNKNPYQQYTGDRVADFSNLQNQAFQGAGQLGPSQQGAMGTGIAALAANQALGAGQNFTPGQFNAGQFNSAAAQQYMSPYQQNVVDIQQREAQRQADVAGTQRNAQAVSAGAFGGSRQAIMDAEAGRNLAMQKGDIQAKGLQDAYTNAQTQFNTDQARGMQAQQLGEQSRQYGAGLGLQGASTALQGANTLGTLGSQQFGQQKDAIGTQALMGTQQQQRNQALLDVNHQNFQNAQQYPYQQLSFRSNMLNGLPMSGSTVATRDTPDPSGVAQWGGLLSAGLGIGKSMGWFSGGGAVHSTDTEPGLMALMMHKLRRG